MRGPLITAAVLLLTVSFHPISTFAAEGERVLEPASGTSLSDGLRTMGEDAKALLTAPSRMDRHDWLLTGGALGAIGLAFALDKPINTFVERNQHAKPHDVADGFNTVGNPTVLLAANVGMIAFGSFQESYGYSTRLKQTGLISLEAEVFAMAATFGLKEISGRSRPDRHEGITKFDPFGNGGSSFTSAHAAASFAMASVLADRYESGWLAYGVAGAVAVSRVYTQQHFSSDVVAGGLIGWGIGRFLSRRHSDDVNAWRVQPAQLLDGSGMGMAIGRRF